MTGRYNAAGYSLTQIPAPVAQVHVRTAKTDHACAGHNRRPCPHGGIRAGQPYVSDESRSTDPRKAERRCPYCAQLRYRLEVPQSPQGTLFH